MPIHLDNFTVILFKKRDQKLITSLAWQELPNDCLLDNLPRELLVHCPGGEETSSWSLQQRKPFKLLLAILYRRND